MRFFVCTFYVQYLKYPQKNVKDLLKRRSSLFVPLSIKNCYGFSKCNFSSDSTTKKEEIVFEKAFPDDEVIKRHRRNDSIEGSYFQEEEISIKGFKNDFSMEDMQEKELEDDRERETKHESMNCFGVQNDANSVEEQNEDEYEDEELSEEEEKKNDKPSVEEHDEEESLVEEHDEEEIEDDIDTLLYSNNLNSSFIGELWHTSANSYYKYKQMRNANGNTKEKRNDENLQDIMKQVDKQKKEDDKTHNFTKEIYEEEKKEAEEMQSFFEKNEEQLTRFRNTIFCRLRLAEEISKKYDHASKDTITTEQEINKRKEEHYRKMIQSLNGTYKEGSHKKKRNSPVINTKYDCIETIKILDIDSLPCNILNHLFAYKIVKNCSAEICLKIITRLGMYRDKYSQISYENMITYLGQIIQNDRNAEIIALFCRCYETISIPFLINYVRKYGSFSRSFLVNMYDKFFRKRLFDFIRYENNMGVRKIPNILTHPYHLSSYVKLLGECSAKKDMYIQLKIKGFIPNTFKWEPEKIEEQNYLDTHSFMDKRKPNKVHFIEKIGIGKEKERKKKKLLERPKMYDIIMSAEYSGVPVENLLETKKDESIEEEKRKKRISYNVETLEPFTLLKDSTHDDTIVFEKGEDSYEKDLPINQEEEKETEKEILSCEVRKREHTDDAAEEQMVEIKKNEKEECREEVNFIMEEECHEYLYKTMNRLNSSSFMLQTTLVKASEEPGKNALVEYTTDNDFDKIEDAGTYEDSLWELPWKTKQRNNFFYKGRFFKIVPGEGWKQIEDVSKNYIKPKRKRQKHRVRRKRMLERKIKINLFKKKMLERNEKTQNKCTVA